MSPDPWTAFLDWLTTMLIPSWGELITLLPVFIVGLVIGPIVMIIVLMWGWYLLKRRRGHVTRAERQPVAALVGADGLAVFPPNVPYCDEHALVYPAQAKECHIDGGTLSVSCPVDGTVRVAEIDVCSACGTKFKLGVGYSAVTVTSEGGPPQGGAAIA
jgi:hypothetical protein